MFDPNAKRENKVWIQSLTSSDNDLSKEAQGKLSEFFVVKARENGIYRKVQPPVNVTIADCVPQVDSPKPVIVRTMQPDTDSAYSLPFGGIPMNGAIGVPRYRIMFERIKSRRLTADILNLQIYDGDLKQIFTDLLLRDLLAEEDRKFLATADTMVGTKNSASTARFALVGAKGYIDLGGPISRATLELLDEGMASTNRHLESAVYLVNNVTIKQVITLDRAAIGGDMAQQILMKGFSEGEILGKQWFSTIKTDLVANNIVYGFTTPDSLGDFLVLEDVTVSTKTENWMLELFCYETVGGTIINTGGIIKGNFGGDAAGDWLV